MEETVDSREASARLADALHQLMPFHYFYEKAGKPLPDFTFLTKSEVPYPYRSMLVHENDMTPTLAAFHHSNLYLEVHEHDESENYLMRLVTLHTVSDDSPVEFGAIGIHLETLPAVVQRFDYRRESAPRGDPRGIQGRAQRKSQGHFLRFPRTISSPTLSTRRWGRFSTAAAINCWTATE